MLNDIITQIKNRMQKTIVALQSELGKIRTGRASISLLDGVTVNYYGAPTPLKQLASLSTPDSNLIAIQPWDPSSISDIEKSILQAGLGLVPNNDGKIIRLPIPPLTEERRIELMKIIKKVAEEARVGIRHIRRDANEEIRVKEKNKEISEDEVRVNQNQTQKITDEFIKKIDDILKVKEKEIMEF